MTAIGGVYKYTLTTAWDISTASYSGQFFSTASQDGTPIGLAFQPDGTRMFVLGFNANQVFQYSLSTPWNLATASYGGIALTIGSDSGGPRDICFSSDGSALYVTGYSLRRVVQYSLPSPWSLSGASFLRELSVNTVPGPQLPYGIRINPAGTRLYVKGENAPCYQYDLGTTSAPIAITGLPYICKLSYMPSDLGGTATEKTVGMIRARFLSSSPIAPQLSVATNYSVDFPPAPAATAIPAGGGSLWGVARWGVSRWGSGDISAVRGTYDTGWISVGANGQVVAPQWQIVIDGDGRPSAELLVIDVLIEPGGI